MFKDLKNLQSEQSISSTFYKPLLRRRSQKHKKEVEIIYRPYHCKFLLFIHSSTIKIMVILNFDLYVTVDN